MGRMILDESRIHPAIREQLASNHREIVAEVAAAVELHDIVIVGMAQNPFPKKARKLLDGAGLAYEYLEYGSYWKMWRPRTALKMWTGWPTFPQIFVKQQFIGGAAELKQLLNSGELASLLAA